MATAAVLLMKAERGPMINIITINWRNRLLPARGITYWASKLTIPVRSMAPLRMNIARTVMVAGLLKPEMASSGVTPKIGPSPKTRAKIARATKSIGKRSKAKTTSAPSKIAKANAIPSVT